jgi:hypothetical protein
VSVRDQVYSGLPGFIFRIIRYRNGALSEHEAGATVRRGDLRGLHKFRELAGERWVAGLVLCTTRQTIPLARGIWAVPIEALWV